jgi:threonine dehydrogenase-like Zn-dependent dehydrogenase
MPSAWVVKMPTHERSTPILEHSFQVTVGNMELRQVLRHVARLKGQEIFLAHIHLHGGPASVRRFLPHLLDLVLDGQINPGKVFDLVLPLEQVADAYRAIDQRRAVKTLLVL